MGGTLPVSGFIIAEAMLCFCEEYVKFLYRDSKNSSAGMHTLRKEGKLLTRESLPSLLNGCYYKAGSVAVDVYSLKAFGSFGNVKGDVLSLFQGLKAA